LKMHSSGVLSLNLSACEVILVTVDTFIVHFCLLYWLSTTQKNTQIFNYLIRPFAML